MSTNFNMDSGVIKRWKTLESLSVEDYFDDITQIKRWSSSGKLNDTMNGATKRNKETQIPGIICGVCNQRFNRPKLLPCLHSFCQSCVESLVKLSEGEENRLEIVCPVCATQSNLPKKIDSLPTNFLLIQTLMELDAVEEKEKPLVICANCEDASRATGVCVQCAEFLCEKCTSAHRRVRLTREHCITPLASQNRPTTSKDQSSVSIELTKCSKHPQEDLAYFCVSCSKLICRECTVDEHEKNSHDFEPLQETSETQKQKLATLIGETKVRLPFMRRTLLEIEHASSELPKHVEAIADEIQESTMRYVRALREREFQLLDDLDALREYKTTLLSEQKEKLLRKVESLESACAFTQRLLNEGDALNIVVVSDYVVERLHELNKGSGDIQPAEGPDVEYVTHEDVLFDVINTGGTVENSTSFRTVRVLGEGLFEASVGKPSTFTIALGEGLAKEDLDVRIETPDGVILSSDITQLSKDIVSVSYTPKIHGEHEISIQVNEKHVEGSPYILHMKKGHLSFASKNAPVCLRFGNKGTGLGETDSPTDLAVRSNGSIVVTDTGNHRIQFFDGRGTVLHEFGCQGTELGKFESPSGICIDQAGNIVVTDQLTNRIQVFTVDGVLIRHFGPKCGKGGEINGPLGTAVDEEGQILVADQLNHRIVVFDNQGSFVHQFGSLGTKDGEFNNPSFIAINQDGEIFVTDCCNHRVQIFDMAGKFIGKFGRPGTGNGEFQYPSGIAVDASGYTFVSDRTNRIQVFNQHYRFVCNFGGKQSGDGQLNSPAGLDYTPEGRVAVADTGNNCIKVFYLPKDQT